MSASTLAQLPLPLGKMSGPGSKWLRQVRSEIRQHRADAAFMSGNGDFGGSALASSYAKAWEGLADAFEQAEKGVPRA